MTTTVTPHAPAYSMSQLVGYMLRLGTFGFGGPVALAGFAFVLPSFLMVVALGFAYAHFGGLPWMQAVFYG
ncbi:chromate transporter, partial [Burkholderia pseudomallei]|nr:chromate transporter [Burkholderia pseudomallei]